MTRRAVIILHPDFDAAGAAGAKSAQEYAQQLAEGVRQTLAQSERFRGNQQVDKLRKYLTSFEYKVRILKDDIL